jgi:hypothetical protein
LLKVALNTKALTNQQTKRVVIAYDRFVVYDAFSHVSLIGGGNRWSPKKPPTCRKSLINFIT